jgi:sodium--glutamate symport carrier gltS
MAIANMTAVIERFGACVKSFIIMPLVGAFFMQNFLNFTV